MSSWPPLDELIWLFEADPVVEYEDLGYPVAATTFTSTRGDTRIECTVEPYTNSLSIRCDEQGQERFRLHLWGIIDEIHIDRVHGREALVASIVNAVPFRRLRLEMRPAPLLTWESVAPWAPGTAS